MMKYLSRILVPICMMGPIACGINMRTAMESDMRFEHCYRIDEDQSIPVEQKRYCWKNWAKSYTHKYNQPRVVYAHKRIRVLENVALLETQPVPSTSLTLGVTIASPYNSPPTTYSTSSNIKLGLQSSNLTCSEQCSRIQTSCAQICLIASQCLAQCNARFQNCMNKCM